MGSKGVAKDLCIRAKSGSIVGNDAFNSSTEAEAGGFLSSRPALNIVRDSRNTWRNPVWKDQPTEQLA